MGSVLEEVVAPLAKLPPEIAKGIVYFIQTLLKAKTDDDRRIALDQAMAAAERVIVEKEFPG
jgi:hypothetical protein